MLFLPHQTILMKFCTVGRAAHSPRFWTRRLKVKVECLEAQLVVMRLEAPGGRAGHSPRCT